MIRSSSQRVDKKRYSKRWYINLVYPKIVKDTVEMVKKYIC